MMHGGFEAKINSAPAPASVKFSCYRTCLRIPRHGLMSVSTGARRQHFGEGVQQDQHRAVASSRSGIVGLDWRCVLRQNNLSQRRLNNQGERLPYLAASALELAGIDSLRNPMEWNPNSS
jgi:hypothetical protein